MNFSGSSQHSCTLSNEKARTVDLSPRLEAGKANAGMEYFGRRGDIMRVVTLSFYGADFTTPAEYKSYISNQLAPFLENDVSPLVVLPGLAGLYLAWRFGSLGQPNTPKGFYHTFNALSSHVREELNSLHRDIAKTNRCWLIPGTVPVTEAGALFHEARLITPEGELIGQQRQVFLSIQERSLGLSRSDDLYVFTADQVKLGILLHTDAFYPETGRILAAKGAQIVVHCGALPFGDNRYVQLSGIWQQVQQNQFFAVESQLWADLAGNAFGAQSIIHAPCEMTSGYTGILNEGGNTAETVSAILDFEAREKVISGYSLLKLLNPIAYTPLACEGETNK
jgi:predicted amidohydrolase